MDQGGSVVERLISWPVGQSGTLAGRLTSWHVGKGTNAHSKGNRRPDSCMIDWLTGWQGRQQEGPGGSVDQSRQGPA